jgi:Rrf2 family transcriptional regulator, iron-sulfur cluster assembly transcription factor
MKLVPTNRTDYGLRALIYLVNATGPWTKAAEIGSAMVIPVGFLQIVLQDLQRSKLVTSKSGPRGGYALARPPDSITVCEVVEALEGPLDAGECALRGGPCHWDEVCALHRVWSSAREALRQRLQSATLADVAADDKALRDGTASVPADAHRRRAKITSGRRPQ